MSEPPKPATISAVELLEISEYLSVQTPQNNHVIVRIILAASFLAPLFVVPQLSAEAKGLTPAQYRMLAKYGPVLKARSQRNHKMTTGK